MKNAKTLFLIPCIAIGQVLAGTSFLNNNAVLSQATRAAVSANGDSHAIATADPNAASAVLDWTKFNIGSGQQMTFNGGGTTFFNLVDGAAGKSQIDGIINGTAGNVWVINPAGVAFSSTAQIDIGGLFAAAAGNISNADALRSGSALLPEFSSFGGLVSSDAGATFSADQVAFLGKSISSVGDFAGVNSLVVGASSGTMTVDDVGGGKVSVNIGDFTAADAEVSLGDLDVGGSLSVKSAGAIVSTSPNASSALGRPMLRTTTTTGSIIQAGDIDMMAYDNLEVDGKLQSTAGNVSLLSYGNIDVNSEVDAYGSVSAGALGNINISADVTARGGDSGIGGVELYAYNGSATVNEGSAVNSVGTVNITAGISAGAEGNIKVDGLVESKTGDVELYSAYGNHSTGDIEINGTVNGNGVRIGSGLADIVYYAETRQHEPMHASSGNGNITVRGAVQGVSDIAINTNEGDINVCVGGEIKTTGNHAALDISAGDGVTISGNVIAENSGDIEIASSQGIFEYEGKGITIASTGRVDAEGDLTFYSGLDAVFYSNGDLLDFWGLGYGGGGIVVDGVVKSRGNMSIYSVEGVTGKGFLDSGASILKVDGGMGAIKFTGQIASGNTTFLSTTYLDYDIVGDVSVPNSDNDFKGVVSASGNNISIVDGNSLALGNVIAFGDVFLRSGEGIQVMAGTVLAEGDVTLAAGGSVLENAAGVVEAGRNLVVTAENGRIGLLGSVSANGDASFNADGRVVVVSENGLISFGGITARGSDVDLTGRGDVSVGDVVATSGNVRLYWSEGNVHIKEGSTVKTLGDSASVNVGIDVGIGSGGLTGNGDVIVDGNVSAEGDGGRVNLLARNGNVVVNGGVDSSGDIYMMAHGDGGAEVGHDALVASREGKVTISSDSKAMFIDGKIEGETGVWLMTYSGDIEVGKSATLHSRGPGGGINVYAAMEKGGRGNAIIKGNLIADGKDGSVAVATAGHSGASGDVIIDGSLTGGSEVSVHGATGANATKGNVTINGSIKAGNQVHAITGNGDIVVSGTGTINVEGEDGLVVMGTGLRSGQHGDINIGGSVFANAIGGEVYLDAGSSDPFSTGGIHLGGSCNIMAGSGAYLITHNGNLTQSGANINPPANGYVSAVSLHSAVTAPTVNLKVDGSVGNGNYGFVAVDGKVFGSVEGDASIAAANGKPFVGGEHIGSKIINFGKSDMGEYGTMDFGSVILDWGNMNGDSTVQVRGGLSIYTASNIEPYGNLLSGRDMTVSARSFGDVSYLRAGGTLTINNVGRPKYPRIAYFESLDGKEPKINNLPNDMVIFVDGRLAGGNINIMNMFGANEAFLVSTPELKSTQGIFGNPPFLHSDLDVANPMEVSAIDYLIQEVPRLTLSSEFPADVDQKVEANGLSLKDSYWFGQERVAKKPSEATDGKVASAEE